MSTTEIVTVIALVLLRAFGVGSEMYRRSLQKQGDAAAALWVRYAALSAGVGWALLAAACFASSAWGGGFWSGLRVGAVLWVCELLLGLPEALGFVEQMRAGTPITMRQAWSLRATSWSVTVLAIPFGSGVGSFFAQ